MLKVSLYPFTMTITLVSFSFFIRFSIFPDQVLHQIHEHQESKEFIAKRFHHGSTCSDYRCGVETGKEIGSKLVGKQRFGFHFPFGVPCRCRQVLSQVEVEAFFKTSLRSCVAFATHVHAGTHHYGDPRTTSGA